MVSGVGLLLLSLTNRFSRVTDRLRELVHERRADPRAAIDVQIAIFHQRARIIRAAVGAAVGCMLMASVMVLLLFATAVFEWRADAVILLLFALSLLCLIGSLLLFLWDMHLSLRAVQRELEA